MNNIVEAEYKVVQERTLPVIASEILQIEENVGRVALDGAIRIGERLKEAKEKVEHGQWENWCRDNLNYSKSKTEKLMKIATEYGDENSAYSKTYTCTDLSISKALRLLQVPEDEVESFVENHDVEDMTVKELEEEISKLKAQIDIVDKENDEYRKEAERYETEIAEQKARIDGYIEEIEDLKESGASPEKLLDEVARLEKKIQNSSNENTLMFKLKVDQIQDAFADCKDCIDAETDAEKRDKMISALTTVLDSMKGGL